MIEHVGPVRRDVRRVENPEMHVEVHEALVSGDQIAARYTLRTTMRGGKRFHGEIYMFGRLAPDGRIKRLDQAGRTRIEQI